MKASAKGDFVYWVTCVLLDFESAWVPGLASGEDFAGAGEPVPAHAKAAASKGKAAHRVKEFTFAMP